MIPHVLQNRWQRRRGFGEIGKFIENDQERRSGGVHREVREEILPRREADPPKQRRVVEPPADNEAQGGKLLPLRTPRRLVVDAFDGTGESGEDPALARPPVTYPEKQGRVRARPCAGQLCSYRIAVDDVIRLRNRISVRRGKTRRHVQFSLLVVVLQVVTLQPKELQLSRSPTPPAPRASHRSP